ncbi:hypothetical protein BsWGS_22529 [Bradybaena similaris]
MSVRITFASVGRAPPARIQCNADANYDGAAATYSDSSLVTSSCGVSSMIVSLGSSGSASCRQVRHYFYGSGGGQIATTGVRPEEVAPAPDTLNVLTVKDVGLDIPTNTKAHHTNKFAVTRPSNPNQQLVVRRGQPFTVTIAFTRPYDEKEDDLKLIFEAGPRPLESKKTRVEFILSHEDIPNEWGAKIVSTQGSTVTIEIFTPPTCFVAKWNFKIDVVKKDDTNVNVYRYIHKNPIYILFNPWCKDDLVYVPDEKLLDEYILNETGRLYRGSASSPSPRPWNFGQFESVVLDVVMYLLDVNRINYAIRGNPIPIVRKLSALVNSHDEGGILSGKWDGEYDDGTPPQAWTGSVAILEEYWKTKQPVKYGQCWVFAAVTTTICRALGIPARVVTNFSSAHDTDGSITIDYHLTADGEPDKTRNYDSVWNFHVWTEVWFARPDLPQGYGGWQVVDATPQEASDGIYCCGPASVKAVQQGEVNLPYDGPFVFAEVNADTFYWTPNELGVMEIMSINKHAIGKSISTKAPNSNAREDVTRAYKFEEDSPEERAAVTKANQVGSSASRDLYEAKANDIKFKIVQDSENTWVGGSFIVSLKMVNKSGENRSIKGKIVISSMYYTGVTADTLKSEPFLIQLKAGEEKVYNFEVTQDEYDGHLKDGCMLDVSAFAQVQETNQNFVMKKDYRLRKPHLTAKAPAKVNEDEEFKVDVSFTNPLKTTLTNCSITVDGVAYLRKFPQANVPAGGTFEASLPVEPEKAGQGEIIVIFNSKQLEDINVAYPIFVQEN